MVFCAGQRWISIAEPELGLGRIESLDRRFVSIVFPVCATTRSYAVEAAPLQRIIFQKGDTIRDRSGRSQTITAITESRGLVTYICGAAALIESDLHDAISLATPRERLLHGIVDRGSDFDLRVAMLEYQGRIRQSPGRGFAGGRIDLLPHQLFIAQTVSSHNRPRALLCDETGLGKTIEAGLVLHKLMLTGMVGRSLVLVPESLVHQWFVELLRRFNLTARLFTKEYCEGFDANVNPFPGDQLGIAALDFLANDTKAGALAVAADWDLVIVDEAHHLHHASPGYRLVENLAARGCGLLLLTATPEQLGRPDHFARLQLIDPHRYPDYNAYETETGRLHLLSRHIEAVLDEKQIDRDSHPPAELTMPIPHELLPVQSSAETAATHTLTLDQLIDLYGTGRAMFRNTRHIVKGFPLRYVHPEALDADAADVARCAQESLGDSGGGPTGSIAIGPDDPRVIWLARLRKELPREKILVMCTTARKALGIQAALQRLVKVDVALFHEEMTLLQRDRMAAWFSEDEGAPILICSESGSEGRNFQFCRRLVLFDLPPSPELLEQRIGRLDRIGQGPEIHLYIPFVRNTPQEIACRWYHEGLNAFAGNVPAAGRVFEAMEERLAALMTNPAAVTPKSLDTLIADSRQLCSELSQQIFKARDRLLEMASFKPWTSADLLNTLVDLDRRNQAQPVMEQLFRHYGIVMEDAGDKKFWLNIEGLTDPLFPLPRQERPVVTFDRPTALKREELEFITIDHPMLCGTLDLFLSSDHGTTAFCVWSSDVDKSELLLETIWIVECLAPPALDAQRFLPPVPVRIVTDHRGVEVSERFPAAVLQQNLRNAAVNRLLANRNIVDKALPMMFEKSATIAESRTQPIMGTAVAAMQRHFNLEIARLVNLQKAAGANAGAEIESLVAARDALEGYFKASRGRLDSLRVIWRGPFKE
jgi:ATP-dependent helicase HepA